VRSRYKLFCFDMDGTLLDSMGYWHLSKIELLLALHLPLEPVGMPDILYRSFREVLEYYREKHGFAYEWDDIIEKYRAVMNRWYRRGIDPKPGAREFLQRLQQEGVRVCVGTATDRNIAREALKVAGLLEYVEFVTDIAEMGSGKENAAFFEKLAERAGVQTDEILMFEDALYAMQGARSAGCGVVAIEEAASERERDEIMAFADRYIRSYHELLEA